MKRKVTQDLKKQRKNLKGFTFLEILIVMTILGILMVFGTPRLKGIYLKNQLRSAARDLATLFRLARSESIYSGGITQVKMNIDEYWYQLVLPPREDNERDRYYDRNEKVREIERKRYIPEEVSIKEISTDGLTDPKNRKIIRILFFPDGTASGTTIVMQNDKKRSMTIDLAPATGISRVYRGAPGQTIRHYEKEE